MQFFIYFTMEDGQQLGQSHHSPEAMAEAMRFMEEATTSGVIVANGKLSSTTTRIRLNEGAVSVTDGPFMEGKELIPGFTIINADSKREAVEWVAKYRDLLGMPELRIAEIYT